MRFLFPKRHAKFVLMIEQGKKLPKKTKHLEIICVNTQGVRRKESQNSPIIGKFYGF